jgi:hypothetical protein
VRKVVLQETEGKSTCIDTDAPQSSAAQELEDDDNDEESDSGQELCTVRSFHGLYLGCDDTGRLVMTPTPCAWMASGNDRALQCLPKHPSMASFDLGTSLYRGASRDIGTSEQVHLTFTERKFAIDVDFYVFLSVCVEPVQ